MPKEEPANYLCRCCHSEGVFKNLYEIHNSMDEDETEYLKLLLDCFNIEMSPVVQSLQYMLCSICEACIDRLQDAAKFKKQVLKCEKRFRDIYGYCISEKVYDVKIKEEPEIEITKDDSVNPLAENQNGISNLNMSSDNEFNKLESTVDDDDDRLSNHNDDFFKERDKEDVILNEANGKRKSRMEQKKIKNKKKKLETDVQTEEIRVIQGMSVVYVKTAPARRDIDFKIVGGMYQCLRCPEAVKSDRSISIHVKKEHFNAARYKCPNCFERFWKLPNLKRHKLEQHNIDNRFKCNACDKAFFTKMQLTTHTESFHMLGEVMTCEECGYETYNKSGFHRHRINHSAEKNHQCVHCHKSFKRRSTMLLHERIHTGDRRKTCSECGQTFVQRTSLKYHMKKHHPGVDF